jgi:hypothetical protein
MFPHQEVPIPNLALYYLSIVKNTPGSALVFGVTDDRDHRASAVEVVVIAPHTSSSPQRFDLLYSNEP